MIPQIPGYLLTFESAVRPLVAAIALGLIWMGAARMKASAQSRYTIAGALSAVLIAWLAVGPVSRLGKCLFRDQRERGADRAVRFADSADDGRH